VYDISIKGPAASSAKARPPVTRSFSLAGMRLVVSSGIPCVSQPSRLLV